MPTKVKILVLSGYGLNCEEETAFGFNQAGGQAEIVHVNDLISQEKSLNNYQILVVPGGFSYGDQLGSGYAFANRLKNNLWQELIAFINQDKLVLGICNGFQILVSLGLLGQVALKWNDDARYIDTWVDLKAEGKTPWLKGIKKLSLAVAHGEGKFYTRVKAAAALKYINNTNPNGSLQDIAGMTDQSGRIFGLMPHPERAQFFTQLPDWPYLKEKLIRADKPLPEFGPGLKIFQNGVKYFR
ncbi:phosphoribosylformylglycinamidine synthase [Candidatus Roizmanbacteria bacterium CG23_combo_of_CG06-09_8_20_14_all_35_49]|uniref:Phosphoribosylformylglycinamidine synthase n=1 Tax=Candidatus Roizmanbacteria bacterium CG23_combo_of_CG06-09_8_20_14_all_35_49 TaxID=1974863 RepID=A0A2G9Y602_9BACT|nr:MAG: phosphoribosylformylglycinamidine synthase [Candidatus Roizmanbacteria bacterium CG23_combo_of_CG06-09_8_20_14_all_35_49]